MFAIPFGRWPVLILAACWLISLTGCSGCLRQTTEATPPPTAEAEEEETDPSRPVEEREETPPQQTADNSAMAQQVAADSSQGEKEEESAKDSADKPERGGKSSKGASGMTAEAALQKAEQLYASAQSSGKDAGKAFQDASKAWELLNQHPENAECQALAEKIAGDLNGMAAKANGQYGSKLSGDRTLINN